MPFFIYDNKQIDYEIRLSKKAKRMSFVVHWDGRAELVVPERARISEKKLEAFVQSQTVWLAKTVKKMSADRDKIPLQHQGVPMEKLKLETEETVWQIIESICDIYPFKVKNVRVRSYKTRWGSCDSDCGLQFHYKLSMLPRHLIEYIVIHELCHTVHHNHSKDFWGLVSLYCPLFKDCKKELKMYLV